MLLSLVLLAVLLSPLLVPALLVLLSPAWLRPLRWPHYYKISGASVGYRAACGACSVSNKMSEIWRTGYGELRPKVSSHRSSCKSCKCFALRTVLLSLPLWTPSWTRLDLWGDCLAEFAVMQKSDGWRQGFCELRAKVYSHRISCKSCKQ